MAEPLKLRLPDALHPHTIEIEVPYDPSRSNWKIRGQEMKSGAGRGASPTWYPFKPGDFALAWQLTQAPVMSLALQAIERRAQELADRGGQIDAEELIGLAETARSALPEIPKP